jgi:AcrR family transcriptional regulator
MTARDTKSTPSPRRRARAGRAADATARRGQGRPPRADADATRARLIAATRTLMHQTKPAKITRFDIALEAGVDPALVRYYFGNKAAVFNEVIRVVSEELKTRRAALPATGPVIVRLQAYLQVWLEVFTDNPHFHELVVEQVFYADEGGAPLRLKKFIERAYPELEALVAEGIASGELRAAEPRFVYLAIVALTEFFATASPLVDALFGKRGAAAKKRADYGVFAAGLLIDGLRKR